jgi:hypothetical protein
MNRAWATSIENFWQSQSLPMWLTLLAAGVFAVVLMVTLFRAERSVANGALTVITLLAIGIAVTTMMRASALGGGALQATGTSPVMQSSASLPALACLDGLAGEIVESACEKSLFASADSAAAGVSYAAAQMSRLASHGNAMAANEAMTPELNALRRTIERDRYGLVAQVLTTREGCTLASSCPFFRSLTNSAQISSNMDDHLYDSLVARYSPGWGAAPAPSASGSAAVPATALAPAAPTGRPMSGDFPSAASIPPVSIMAAEPSAQGSQATHRPTEPAPARQSQPSAAAGNAAPAPAAPKKPAAQKPPAAAQKSRAQAPVQLAPPQESDDN